MPTKNHCWDCLYFKTREYNKLSNDIKNKFFASTIKLVKELRKARKKHQPARYFRCSLYRTKQEVYILERTARELEACKLFEDMRHDEE